jgi:hypothetical protein
MMDISKAWDLHEQVDVTYIDGHVSSVDDDQIVNDDTGKVYDDIASITLEHRTSKISWVAEFWQSDTYTADEFQRFVDTW